MQRKSTTQPPLHDSRRWRLRLRWLLLRRWLLRLGQRHLAQQKQTCEQQPLAKPAAYRSLPSRVRRRDERTPDTSLSYALTITLKKASAITS